MSESVEHVIVDSPAPPVMPDPAVEAAARVTVIEAEAEATADVIEAQAEAEVEIIEARSEAPEWRDQLYQDVTRLQEESSRATAEQIAALRTDMMTGLAMLSERMDQLIQTSPPTEQVPPNPDPGQSEATSGNGSAAEQPASENAAEIVEEPAKEPDKPERRRAHRWI